MLSLGLVKWVEGGSRDEGERPRAGGIARRYDADRDPAAILAGMQASTLAIRGREGLGNCRGIFREVGSSGMTRFNTIVAPDSTQYNWGDCRFTGGGYPNDATFADANRNHPGGVNMLMADGSVRFVKGSINRATLAGPRHQGQRRGHLVRRVSMRDRVASSPG